MQTNLNKIYSISPFLKNFDVYEATNQFIFYKKDNRNIILSCWYSQDCILYDIFNLTLNEKLNFFLKDYNDEDKEYSIVFNYFNKDLVLNFFDKKDRNNFFKILNNLIISDFISKGF